MTGNNEKDKSKTLEQRFALAKITVGVPTDGRSYDEGDFTGKGRTKIEAEDDLFKQAMRNKVTNVREFVYGLIPRSSGGATETVKTVMYRPRKGNKSS